MLAATILNAPLATRLAATILNAALYINTFHVMGVGHIYIRCGQPKTKNIAAILNHEEIFYFGQISKFKKGVIPRKKYGINTSCGYARLHGMYFTTTKIQEILSSGFRGVALTNCFSRIFHNYGQISKFKKGVTPRKKNESKFPLDMRIYTLCPI